MNNFVGISLHLESEFPERGIAFQNAFDVLNVKVEGDLIETKKEQFTWEKKTILRTQTEHFRVKQQ